MSRTNRKQRTLETCVALQFCQELTRRLGPVLPEVLAENDEVVGEVFGETLDANEIVDEAAAERILLAVPPLLADISRQFFELSRKLDLAVTGMAGARRDAPTQLSRPATFHRAKGARHAWNV